MDLSKLTKIICHEIYFIRKIIIDKTFFYLVSTEMESAASEKEHLAIHLQKLILSNVRFS